MPGGTGISHYRPVGLYGDVILRQRQVSRLDDISMRQRHEDGVVHIDITAFCEILEPGTVGIAARTGEHAVSDERQLWPGEQTLDISPDNTKPKALVASRIRRTGAL